MRIYAMTATFGKLEHETLTLQPGLNIIEAPNEWGKSTWCAFLVAMLYGLDTRAKTTKTALAEKERYAPWSGSPMAGRIDLHWNGRDITIERQTRGRTPMGEFRAYETKSGLAVPELTAANCGFLLLGVERSVFLRSAFLRLSDLPVTNDDALRRRLNALVTTGDESSAGDRLEKGLKELKNRIRYHRTGLIPQAEQERAALEETISQLQSLEGQCGQLQGRMKEVEQWISQLENHQKALAQDAARQDEARVAEARQLRNEAAARLDALQALCAELPQREEIRWMLDKLSGLEEALQSLQMEEQMLQLPVHPVEKPRFAGEMGPEDTLRQVKADAEAYQKTKMPGLVWWLAAVMLTAAGGIAAFWQRIPGLVMLCVGAAALGALLILTGRKRRAAGALERIYGSADPALWLKEAEAYAAAVEAAKEAARQQTEIYRDLKARKQALDERIRQAAGGQPLAKCRQAWEQSLGNWDARADAGRDYQRAENHYQTLKAMAKTAPEPAEPDTLTYSEGETARLLSDAKQEKSLLESRLNQYSGRMEAMGDPDERKVRLEQVNSRLQKLEQTYAALTLAQETLAQATAELQRRFAPRIAGRAQEMMGMLTNGRYRRLRLKEDLSVLAGAESEDTLREILWRSDGTVDQLYLALRLAVAEELTPDAPLILDDALVRFDDTRLKAAIELLKAQSETKQVILFSCQSREKNAL